MDPFVDPVHGKSLCTSPNFWRWRKFYQRFKQILWTLNRQNCGQLLLSELGQGSSRFTLTCSNFLQFDNHVMSLFYAGEEIIISEGAKRSGREELVSYKALFVFALWQNWNKTSCHYMHYLLILPIFVSDHFLLLFLKKCVLFIW